MVNLNIITRCTRFTKIREIYSSFENNSKLFKLNWYVLFDLTNLIEISTDILSFLNPIAIMRFYDSQDGDFGHDMINKTIDEITDGLIYVLDDDNILHPNFIPLLENWFTNHPHKDGIIFSQKIGGIDFTGEDLRIASPENVKVSKIDMAQFCMKRELYGNHRIPKNMYVGDGVLIEEIYNNNVDRFWIVDEIACYYNYFKQIEVKDYFLPRVLVIGDKLDFELKSHTIANWEDERLKVLKLDNDENIDEILTSFKPNSILTVGGSWEDFKKLNNQNYHIRRTWLHTDIKSPDIGDSTFNCASVRMFDSHYYEDPLVSVFTPLHNTGDVLWRSYESMSLQTHDNWEWVLVDDSSDGGKTLKIAKKIASKDHRVKVYDFREKSGGIVGESKYRAASLCSGVYLVEFDHDDYLLPDALKLTVEAFRKYPDCKFVFSDCAEIDENHNSLTYGDGFAFGYGSYKDQVYNGKVYKTVQTQNINPKTIRHIVGVPNHLRAWDRFFYHSIGGHNRHLSIADDYELLVRSFLKTRFVRIPKLLYLQFMHSSNTQNVSRADIQRRVRSIANYYNLQIKERFEELGVEDWAFNENPHFPTMSPSRFGKDEGSVSYIWNQDDLVYNSNVLESNPILN